jgi:hypothetical protein
MLARLLWPGVGRRVAAATKSLANLASSSIAADRRTLRTGAQHPLRIDVLAQPG